MFRRTRFFRSGTTIVLVFGLVIVLIAFSLITSNLASEAYTPEQRVVLLNASRRGRLRLSAGR